jgi:Ca2+-binding RTX toxin-like protein
VIFREQVGHPLAGGGRGNDVLLGGAGTDVVRFDDRGLTANLKRHVASADRIGLNTLRGIENLETLGGSAVLIGDAGPNSLVGGGGRDTIRGRGANDFIAGSFVESGWGRSNSLFGGRGNDMFDADGSNDTIHGGYGSDTVSYSDRVRSTVIDLQAGVAESEDELKSIENAEGSPANDVLRGDSSANRLLGHDGDDQISGVAGDDFLDGGGGSNDNDGGDGTDTCYNPDTAGGAINCEG